MNMILNTSQIRSSESMIKIAIALAEEARTL